MPTPEGDFHVKFVRPDGEARRAPINELLAHGILERLGCDRPRPAIVELPEPVKLATPELSSVIGNEGFGTERMDRAKDLDVAAMAVAAADAPDRELFAQYVVLTWLQNTDHAGGNWMTLDNRVIAVDFASSPEDSVWTGADMLEARIDHGGLRSRVDRVEDHVRSDVLSRLGLLTADDLEQLLSQAPDYWATTAERQHVAEGLDRTKEALRAEFT